MKVYAVINGVLDEQTYMLLNKSGIRSRNFVYEFDRIKDLFSVVEVGDRVVVVSIRVFRTCNNLNWVLTLLMRYQISFESIQEKIKFTNKQLLKESYKNFISKVAQYEQIAVNNCDSAYKYIDRTEMIRTIRALSLSIVIEALKHDGLLRR